jgi:nicotinamidase-related amidase
MSGVPATHPWHRVRHAVDLSDFGPGAVDRRVLLADDGRPGGLRWPDLPWRFALTAIHGQVAPEPGDIVVSKTRVGAFSTTDLGVQLWQRGIDTLLLAGLSTSGVLLSTVRDASDRDYRVVVVADLSADPEPDVHYFVIHRIFPRQGHVLASADLAGLLSAGA